MSVVFEIPTGTSTNAIGDLLRVEGIIESAFVWKNWYVRFRGIGPFEAGYVQPQEELVDRRRRRRCSATGPRRHRSCR